jgi:hypothetical protein
MTGRTAGGNGRPSARADDWPAAPHEAVSFGPLGETT